MITQIKNGSPFLSQIAALEKKYFSSCLSEEELCEMAAKAPYFLYALTDGERLLAYIAATVTEYDCQIIKIAVSEQKRGYGKKILNTFCENFSDRPVFLEVRASNLAAIALYISAGFVVDGTRKRLYQSPVEDGIIMHKEAKTQ